MKKYFTLLIILITSTNYGIGQIAKIASEFTVVYDVAVTDAKADPQIVKAMSGATKVLYIKGSKSRSELITPGFQQTTIYDSKADSTVVLREFGNTKYISFFDVDKRNVANKKFEGVTFVNTDETKTILGYDCKKVIAKLKDGSSYNIYYTPSLVPSAKGYEYQFKDLPGLVLEYEAETEDGKSRIKYSASKITFTPVSIAKFDIPKTGYRVL